jgi:hypothetical protein
MVEEQGETWVHERTPMRERHPSLGIVGRELPESTERAETQRWMSRKTDDEMGKLP